MSDTLAIFENYKIRRQYDEKTETWFFSVVDIIAALTAQSDFQTARKYWNKMKERLIKEGNESVTNCHQLKQKNLNRFIRKNYPHWMNSKKPFSKRRLRGSCKI